jgi:hypothetical protein
MFRHCGFKKTELNIVNTQSPMENDNMVRMTANDVPDSDYVKIPIPNGIVKNFEVGRSDDPSKAAHGGESIKLGIIVLDEEGNEKSERTISLGFNNFPPKAENFLLPDHKNYKKYLGWKIDQETGKPIIPMMSEAYSLIYQVTHVCSGAIDLDFDERDEEDWQDDEDYKAPVIINGIEFEPGLEGAKISIDVKESKGKGDNADKVYTNYVVTSLELSDEKPAKKVKQSELGDTPKKNYAGAMTSKPKTGVADAEDKVIARAEKILVFKNYITWYIDNIGKNFSLKTLTNAVDGVKDDDGEISTKFKFGSKQMKTDVLSEMNDFLELGKKNKWISIDEGNPKRLVFTPEKANVVPEDVKKPGKKVKPIEDEDEVADTTVDEDDDE